MTARISVRFFLPPWAFLAKKTSFAVSGNTILGTGEGVRSGMDVCIGTMQGAGAVYEMGEAERIVNGEIYENDDGDGDRDREREVRISGSRVARDRSRPPYNRHDQRPKTQQTNKFHCEDMC